MLARTTGLLLKELLNNLFITFIKNQKSTVSSTFLVFSPGRMHNFVD